MTQRRRAPALLALCVVAGTLAACGGGSDSTSLAVTTPKLSDGGSNVVAVTVDSTTPGNNINIPQVSVTVCLVGTTDCTTIDHVLVDTGSTGLRLFASTLTGLSSQLAVEAASGGSQALAECLPFVDNTALWGPVALADVQVGGETASSVPVQVIDDNDSTGYAGLVPSSCSTASSMTPTTFGANGVLGIGLFKQDCGSACTTSTYQYYYSCSSSSCSEVTVPEAEQITNPVTLFATDNNGVILQLPAVSAAGSASVTGYLAFGIGTASNNFLGSAKPLTADDYGNIITQFNGQTLSESFIDSGTNAYAFSDSSSLLPTCSGSGDITYFYCPDSTQSLSATNQGQNGTTQLTDFSVANAIDLFNGNDGSGYAFNDLGATLSGTDYDGTGFDWGLPFFYGRTVYFAIEGASAGGTTGPYFAY